LRPDNESQKCYRTHLRHVNPDNKTGWDQLSVTYASSGQEATKKAKEASMYDGVFYVDPGWCEFRSRDGKVWSSLTPRSNLNGYV